MNKKQKETIDFMLDYLPGVTKIKYNYPATILWFVNGGKVVVKHRDGRKDLEKAILFAYAKYIKGKKKSWLKTRYIAPALVTSYYEPMFDEDEQKELNEITRKERDKDHITKYFKKNPLTKNLVGWYFFDKNGELI